MKQNKGKQDVEKKDNVRGGQEQLRSHGNTGRLTRVLNKVCAVETQSLRQRRWTHPQGTTCLHSHSLQSESGIHPQSREGLLQTSRCRFDEPQDLHPTPRSKTAARLSFPPPGLYDLECVCGGGVGLSYRLCFGQKKNKNATQLRDVEDAEDVEDVEWHSPPQICGEFRVVANWRTSNTKHKGCVFAAGAFTSNHNNE
ncbi:hypothetical protein JOB18_036292 [Solea senegalensis]|uniref:Uncharacterized protein n=1 Tax=Solea senegalensis TaxID=28829 RepID=A0AAV6Q0H6_SOLSE|nr:hypothetical protein JOB18_036292 [Solea senegalensis]